MIVLSLDTSLGACSAAVTRGGQTLAASSEPMLRGHQERLALLVRETLRAAGLAFADLDRIGVTVGPGSFTGLRVGLAFAKGLGLALGKPCVGIGTLEALAASEPGPGLTAAVIDAKRGQVYLQMFESGAALMAPDSLPVEVAAARLAELWRGGPARLVGPGAGLLADVSPDLAVIERASPDPGPVRPGRPAPGDRRRPAALPARARRQAARRSGLRPTGQARMRLRVADASDAMALARVHAGAFDAPWPPEAFVQLLDSPGVFALAVVEDAPVALILMRAIAGEAEVLTLAVAPTHRRRGAARALLEAGLGVAAVLGAESSFLEAAADNAAALALYLGAGFEAVGRRAGYYHRADNPPTDALVLRRALNSPSA